MQVINEMVAKYENALGLDDSKLCFWLMDFGKQETCPACAEYKHAACADCPARVYGLRCSQQDWYEKLYNLGHCSFGPYLFTSASLDEARVVIITRLRFWKNAQDYHARQLSTNNSKEK
jgi:hypothetical protein